MHPMSGFNKFYLKLCMNMLLRNVIKINNNLLLCYLLFQTKPRNWLIIFFLILKYANFNAIKITNWSYNLRLILPISKKLQW